MPLPPRPPLDAADAAAPSTAGKVAVPKNAGPKGQAGKDASLTAAAATEGAAGAAPAAKDAAERPVKAEVPGGEADKRTAQGAATEQQKTASEVITHVASAIASWFGSWSSWFGHHDDASAQGAQGAKMSDDESRRMASSVDQIPTTAGGVSTELGPPPELAMKGDAKARADRDRAAFEAKAAAAEAQSRPDTRAPMGEDQIDATAPPEELTAMSLVAGTPAATPAAAMPSLASAPSEEVGIVAQQQHGAEIDAALAKASADVGSERAKHAEQEARVRAESDAEVRDLKSKADADQAAARESARAEAGAARSQWQAEIDKHGADARKQADRKLAEGMAQVEAEQAKANEEARRHIEEGKRKAEEEKQKGEKEAADAKEKAKHKSSGFWGWVSSKAKAAFDGVKKAVSSAIDACRRAVKAVIEGAKKLAMAAIELARKAINAVIRAIGQALIAISDVLLAAFPQLKARFQGLIRKAVDKATAAVNRIADGLKQAVQKALDRLGSALDQALQLLEKGIHAIIDAASAVVQGAIKAAQAVVEALGTWAKLIKDVASGPGAWLGKLGAAIVDGIKNHLWSAFKTAVVEWFKAKVFELLGVGGIILELLLEGGLTKEHIIQMAMDALMVAIPAALIAILVEKLVAMIVPAAGAVMAIIEGLQAAWGTISRIIAAFSAFVGFLLAVKSGSAGPLFAGLLAAAAVVVLDFVANWLLRKLASAARKVGAKLKGLAEKFKAKRKAKKDANAKKHHGDDHDGKNRDDDSKKSKEDRKKEEIEKRVEKAQRELPPKIRSFLSRRRSKLVLRGQFALWKLRYRLSRLELREGAGAQATIVAQVNPPVDLGPDGHIWKLELSQVLRIFDEVAGQYVGRAANDTNPDLRKRAEGEEAHLEREGKYIIGNDNAGREAAFDVERKRPGTWPPWSAGKDNEVRRTGAADGDAYEKLLKDLTNTGVDPKALGAYLRAGFNKQTLPSLPPGAAEPADALLGLLLFEAGHPRTRIYEEETRKNVKRVEPSFGHRRDYTYAMIAADLLESGHIDLRTALMEHPAQGSGAQPATRQVTAVHVTETQREPANKSPAYVRRETREIALIRRWLHAKASGPDAPIWREEPSEAVLRAFVIEKIQEFRQ